METPTPRVLLGLALRGIATAAADISDGLLGDLGHILKASGVGASLNLGLATSLLGCGAFWSGPSDLIETCILSGGDDYELVFTAPSHCRDRVQAAATQSDTPVTRIGTVRSALGIDVRDAQGQPLTRQFTSFDHFATS
jgi:thiamine-monophosphate kinase